MKIIRLTSSEDTAYFDSNFNDDITLSQNSEIALHSLSTETKPSILNLTDVNNTIQLQIQNGSIYEPEVKIGTYTKSNYQGLFDSIGGSINDSLDGNKDQDESESFPSGAQVGMQWKALESTGDEGKAGSFAIGYKVANNTGMKSDTFYAENVTITTPTAGGTYKRTGTGGGDLESYLYSTVPITQGCGHYSLKLSTLADDNLGPDADQGVFIGLTNIDPSTVDNPTREMCEIGIQATYNSGVIIYNYGSDFEVENGSQNITEGGRIGFERYNGIFEAVYYTSNQNDRSELFQVDGELLTLDWLNEELDTDDRSLWVVCFLIGSNTEVVVDTVRWSPDAWALTDPTPPKIFNVGPQNPNTSTQGFILFSEELARYLGFNNLRTPTIGTQTFKSKKYFITAPNTFKSGLPTDSFYIEMLSLNLDCYDGLTRGRKSILAVIPQSDSDNSLLYEPDFPVFVSLNNQNEITLRNIRCRVLHSDGSPLSTDGLSVLTLLFK